VGAAASSHRPTAATAAWWRERSGHGSWQPTSHAVPNCCVRFAAHVAKLLELHFREFSSPTMVPTTTTASVWQLHSMCCRLVRASLSNQQQELGMLSLLPDRHELLRCMQACHSALCAGLAEACCIETEAEIVK